MKASEMAQPPPYTLVQGQHPQYPSYNSPQSPQIQNYLPYTATLPITDVTRHSHSTFTRCNACNSLGLTRVEKRFSVVQVILGIVLICTCYLIFLGILVLIFAMDYDHFCPKCNSLIGRKKRFC
jgi:hypothetical protein